MGNEWRVGKLRFEAQKCIGSSCNSQDEHSKYVQGLRSRACFPDRIIMAWSLIRWRDQLKEVSIQEQGMGGSHLGIPCRYPHRGYLTGIVRVEYQAVGLSSAGAVYNLSLESRCGYWGNLSLKSRKAEGRQKDRARDQEWLCALCFTAFYLCCNLCLPLCLPLLSL